jgi:hypothetical protein
MLNHALKHFCASPDFWLCTHPRFSSCQDVLLEVRQPRQLQQPLDKVLREHPLNLALPSSSCCSPAAVLGLRIPDDPAISSISTVCVDCNHGYPPGHVLYLTSLSKEERPDIYCHTTVILAIMYGCQAVP